MSSPTPSPARSRPTSPALSAASANHSTKDTTEDTTGLQPTVEDEPNGGDASVEAPAESKSDEEESHSQVNWGGGSNTFPQDDSDKESEEEKTTAMPGDSLASEDKTDTMDPDNTDDIDGLTTEGHDYNDVDHSLGSNNPFAGLGGGGPAQSTNPFNTLEGDDAAASDGEKTEGGNAPEGNDNSDEAEEPDTGVPETGGAPETGDPVPDDPEVAEAEESDISADSDEKDDEDNPSPNSSTPVPEDAPPTQVAMSNPVTESPAMSTRELATPTPPPRAPTPPRSTSPSVPKSSPTLSNVSQRQSPRPQPPAIPGFEQYSSPAPPPHMSHSRSQSMHYYSPSHPPPGAAVPYYQPTQYMNAYPGAPGYGMPPHGTPPYQASPHGYPPHYGIPPSSPTLRRHDSVASRHSIPGDFSKPSLTGDTGVSFDEDPASLLTEISSALPDLHATLSRYNNAYDQLGVRAERLRHVQQEQVRALREKERHVETLTRQVEDSTKRYEAESGKLRMQIGNLEDKKSDLEDDLADMSAGRKEAEELNRILGARISDLEEQHIALQNEKEEAEKRVEEEQDKLRQEFADWKAASTEAFETEKQEIITGLEKKLKDQEDRYELAQAKMLDDHLKEKDAMRSTFQHQKREQETSFEMVRKELENNLSRAQQDLEQALRKERESREVWSTEREALIKAWEEERDNLSKGFEEQRELLNSQHKKERDDLQRTWMILQADLTKKADEEKDALAREKAEVKRGWDEDKERFERILRDLQSVADNLGTEKSKLQKMLEDAAEHADVKGKGDEYYVDSFSQLWKQILDLSNTHSVNVPSTLPEHIVEKVPSDLPSLLDDSTVSRHLRAACMTHLICDILTTRIFSPFLFSLDRRGDTNAIFTTISNELRAKSSLKEAVWRQHTLMACFTSEGAKKSMNYAAGQVVDEIVACIRPFGGSSSDEMIRINVRSIVKLAAETWRYARLERGTVRARMAEAGDVSEEDQAAGLWLPHTVDQDVCVSLGAETIEETTPDEKIIFPLIPVVRREPLHESCRLGDKEHVDTGRIYSRGLAIYGSSLRKLQGLGNGIGDSSAPDSGEGQRNNPFSGFNGMSGGSVPESAPPPYAPGEGGLDDEERSPSEEPTEPAQQSVADNGGNNPSEASQQPPSPSFSNPAVQQPWEVSFSGPPRTVPQPESQPHSSDENNEPPTNSEASGRADLEQERDVGNLAPTDVPTDAAIERALAMPEPEMAQPTALRAGDPTSIAEPSDLNTGYPATYQATDTAPASQLPSGVATPLDEESRPGTREHTPPLSRAATPPSPLFPAVDEIDGLQHRPGRLRPSVGSRRTSNASVKEIHGAAGGRRDSFSLNASGGESGGRGGPRVVSTDGRSAAIKGLYRSPSRPKKLSGKGIKNGKATRGEEMGWNH